MARKAKTNKQIPPPIPSAPFFEKLDQKQGAASAWAKAHDFSPAQVSNWRNRGIPPEHVTKAAALLGMTGDEYLELVGAKKSKGSKSLSTDDIVGSRELWEKYCTAAVGVQNAIDSLLNFRRRGPATGEIKK